MVRGRVSEPLKELPNKSSKHVRHCEEIYLGKRGITHIGNFDKFTNLVTVFLCDNQIDRLENLECCRRLKHVYAHNNVLTSIDSECLRKMTFLETLSLRDNRLRDLRAIMHTVSHLSFLHDLTLDGNPCAEEQNYRLIIVGSLPHLHVLDNQAVTDNEREEASAFRDGERDAQLSRVQ
jgi:hypothetical protein